MKRATFEGLDPNNPDDVLNVRGYYAHLERLKTNGHAEPKIGSRAATQNKTFVLQAFNEIAIGSKSVTTSVGRAVRRIAVTSRTPALALGPGPPSSTARRNAASRS